MDKARRRFANLQEELKNVSPSERKYKVKEGREVDRENRWLKVLSWVLVGDSKSNYPSI
jgi:hypothetical protein